MALDIDINELQRLAAMEQNPAAPDLQLAPASQGVEALLGRLPSVKPKRSFGETAGRIGDILALIGGRQPLYQPMRQREQEIEAFRGFTKDPLGAIERLGAVNPQLARDWFSDYQRTLEQRGGRQALEAQRRQELENTAVDRAIGLLGTATDDASYQRLRPIAQRYLDRIGAALPVELPETYDPVALGGLRGFAITPETQARLATQEARDKALGEYRGERLEQGYAFEEGREARAAASEAGRTERAIAAERGRQTRFESAQKGKRPAGAIPKEDREALRQISRQPGQAVRVKSSGRVYIKTETGWKPR